MVAFCYWNRAETYLGAYGSGRARAAVAIVCRHKPLGRRKIIFLSSSRYYFSSDGKARGQFLWTGDL